MAFPLARAPGAAASGGLLEVVQSNRGRAAASRGRRDGHARVVARRSWPGEIRTFRRVAVAAAHRTSPRARHGARANSRAPYPDHARARWRRRSHSLRRAASPRDAPRSERRARDTACRDSARGSRQAPWGIARRTRRRSRARRRSRPYVRPIATAGVPALRPRGGTGRAGARVGARGPGAVFPRRRWDCHPCLRQPTIQSARPVARAPRCRRRCGRLPPTLRKRAGRCDRRYR